MQQQFGTLKRSTVKIPSGAKVSIKKIGQTKGYDGHCLRAFSYFIDEMPDIEDTVDSINRIKKEYGGLRQESKAPT